jgi:hypothetical protein
MSIMEPRFITGAPALVAGDALVVADLHIGIEWEFFKAGIKVPSNTNAMRDRLDKIVKETGVKRLVILGDIKHRVPGSTKQELREVPEFLSHFSGKMKVELLPGNHDGRLMDFVPRGVKIQKSTGMAIGNCFFVHGHTWPSEGFLKSDYVIVGHEHPQVEFRDKLGYRFLEQVWIRAQLRKKPIAKRYKMKDSGKMRLPEMIIMPRFNPLCGGISMNQPLAEIEKEHKKYNAGLGPLVRSSDLQNSSVYLLDGTLLGKMKGLRGDF